MAILDPIRFQGTLSRGDATVAIAFVAGIDDDGGLVVTLDPIIPAANGTAFVPSGEVLATQVPCILRGESDDVWRFSSEHFHVSRWSHPEGRVEISGYCSLAELSHDVGADHPDIRAWYFRKLGTFHGMTRETPLGRLVFTGYTDGADQEPISVLAIHAAGQEDEQWWSESERFLIHLERVMSLACGVYLVPIYEQRVRSGVRTLTTVQRGRTWAPYMAPFDVLSMWSIFDCAIASFETRSDIVEHLDPAIRWITASVAYEESRLINAMSALESILANSGLPDLYVENAATFSDLTKKVRKLLKEEKAPSRMGGKINELNRRSFREKLEQLLADRAIATSDFPDGWMAAIISARNVIVHTGVSPMLVEPGAQILHHIVWAREIVIRIILDAIGYEGPFQSWLHRSELLDFPSCRPMSEIAAERKAAAV